MGDMQADLTRPADVPSNGPILDRFTDAELIETARTYPAADPVDQALIEDLVDALEQHIEHDINADRAARREPAPASTSRPLAVTVTVDLDDVRDAIAWHERRGGEIDRDRTFHQLAIHATLTGERRETYWQALPVSLQYCIHEIEHGRIDQLRALLPTTASTRYRTEGEEP